MAKKTPSPFGPGLLRFLRGIQRNNDRVWFNAHKEDYEEQLREPALQFIRAMAPHVKKVSPHLKAVDKKAGGSLMRIYRDTRFSKIKLPYKTNVGVQFRHEQGKDVHAPGLYFHVEPGSVFLGAGMWHPEAGALKAIRKAIVDDTAGWKRVRDAKRFRDCWHLAGDSLKRAPRDFPSDHPMIDDLRRKDHIAVCEMEESEVLAPGLVDNVAEKFRRASAYMRWQAKALGLPF